jgi:hypothetical protein
LPFLINDSVFESCSALSSTGISGDVFTSQAVASTEISWNSRIVDHIKGFVIIPRNIPFKAQSVILEQRAYKKIMGIIQSRRIIKITY